MLRPIVKNVLIDLVRDREHVIFDTQIANQLQFLPAENLARRIVRRVHDDGLGTMRGSLVLTDLWLRLKSLAQFLFVERPLASRHLWWPQTDKTRLRSAQHSVGPIVLIERLKHHDLVALVAD